MNNPLGEYSELGRWIFVYDYDDDRGGGFVTGEFLLRSDGVAFRRMGYATGSSVQSWKFLGEWTEVAAWTPQTDVPLAIRALKGLGYGIHDKHSNVPIDADQGEPFDYDGAHPTYL